MPMAPVRNGYSWPDYVLHVAGTEKRAEIANKVGVRPPTISRWLTGEISPENIDPAHVAKFATEYGRNPLEAFVAADLLDYKHAVRGLTDEELAFLAEVESAEAFDPPSSRAASRSARK